MGFDDAGGQIPVRWDLSGSEDGASDDDWWGGSEDEDGERFVVPGGYRRPTRQRRKERGGNVTQRTETRGRKERLDNGWDAAAGNGVD